MATRAIKKLTKNDDLKKLSETIRDKDESESDTDEPIAPVNKFNLLDLMDQDDGLKDDDDKSQSENEAPKPMTSQKNKKKQKSKKKAGFKYVSSNIDEDEMLNEMGKIKSAQINESREIEAIRKCLQIEPKYLNADNEMTRIFGSRVVQSERNDHRNRRTIINRKTIVRTKPTWPGFRKFGLSMKIEKENPEDGSTEFAFEHNKDYQKTQFLFLDAVEAMDPNSIMAVLMVNPYHIDSLIQLSEISRTHDDTQTAADLIERSIYAFQNSFHPAFNLSKWQGGRFKLDYNRVENRGFYISLFKHIGYVGGKACYRTSLELSKLLLGFDHVNDPLAAILLIDFYAIRSSQYQYLVDFYESFRASKHLDLMPNMVLSVALAYFYLSKTNKELLDTANQRLRDALLKFPMVLMPLLDKCGVMPDKRAESSGIFSKASHLKTPTGLKCLSDLYVERMYHEWKISENLEWMEITVRGILENEKSLAPSVNETMKKWQSLFAKVPPNVYRHLILSDLKEVPANLPSSYPSTATYTFDPVPPKNSITSYTRPERDRSRTDQTGEGLAANPFLSFFQSLIPNVNLQPRPAGNAPEGAAAQPARINMNQLVEGLRDFLLNVENQFPAAPLNQDTDEDDDEDQDNVDRGNLDQLD